MSNSTAPKAGAPSLAGEEVPALLAFLEEVGAGKSKHTQRTLLDHFLGVGAILQRWGAPARVWKAGLFHSIYGTEFFKDAMLPFDQRPRVVAKIGTDAERLAYLFCAFDRSSLYRAIDAGPPFTVDLLNSGEKEPVSGEELRDLMAIVWANVLEQLPRMPRSEKDAGRTRAVLARYGRLLPEGARRDLAQAYGEARTGPRPGLRALFGIDDPKDFLEKAWPHDKYVATGPVERLAGLVDYDLEDLVRMRKGYTRAFFRSLDGKSSQVNVAPGQEKELYDAGFTIYFHALHAPRLDEWVEAMDEELGLVRGGTRVAAFASRRGLGLKPHYDMNDNFVCQAKGVKRWRIAPNTHVKDPTVGYTVGMIPGPQQAAEAPNGFPTALPEPYEVVEMRAGTVMFMPRGMWHDTETLDESSLHFNIQSGLATWKDAVEYLLSGTTALHHEELRGAVMDMFDGDKLADGVADELKKKVRALAEQIAEGEVTINKAAFERFVARRRNNA